MYFDQAKFGCRLRTLRKRRRMTQETLAGALNISIDHLSKIEHGKRGVSIDLLLDISEAVDTSLDYLLKGTAHTRTTPPYKNPFGRVTIYSSQRRRLFVP